MTDEELKSIKARADGALSPAWWTVGNTVYIRPDQWLALPGATKTAEFIAHARQDVPALVAEVERLRAEVAILKPAVAGAGAVISERAALRAEVGALTATYCKMREALEVYGEHQPGCAIELSWNADCDCGFNDALAVEKKSDRRDTICPGRDWIGSPWK